MERTTQRDAVAKDAAWRPLSALARAERIQGVRHAPGVCAGVSVRACGRACQCLWASLSLASLWVEDVLECTGRSTNNTNI